MVYGRGSFHPDSDREYGVETTVVPASSVIAFKYMFKYPGVYLLVKHELIKATEKRQAVQIRVEGETNPDIMTVASPPSQIN